VEELNESGEEIKFVRPASPLLSTAFGELEKDDVFSKRVEKAITTGRITYLQDKINAIETELVKLEEAKLEDDAAGKQRKKNLTKKLGELDVKLQGENAILAKLPSSY